MFNKIIMYLEGGAMSGVFGAGVLAKLLENDFYPHIEAIYAASSGAINGAYFLARQQFSSFYYNELTHDFILPHRIIPGIGQLLWNRFISPLPREKAKNVIDVDYVFSTLKEKKPLDVEKLKEQDIPLYAKLLSVSTGDIFYKEVTKSDDPFIILKAAVCIKPYYFSTQTIDGKEYIDGAIKESLGLGYLLAKHPHSKIAVILNEPVARQAGHTVKNFIEGLCASLYPYPIPLFSYFMARERLVREDIAIAHNNPRVLLVSPPPDNLTVPQTTNPSNLKDTYEKGREEAEKIVNFVKT